MTNGSNRYMTWMLENRNIAKISLSLLFLTEGSKRKKGSLVFCNSDPEVIELFLRLLRFCYSIHEEKFRCTVQCRADQDVKRLEKFWSQKTSIAIRQFSKAQVDKRTVGKPTKKFEYMGVCRIVYYSAAVFNDLLDASALIKKGH